MDGDGTAIAVNVRDEPAAAAAAGGAGVRRALICKYYEYEH